MKTIGERIVEQYRNTVVSTHAESDERHKKIARLIDSAVKKGFKDGLMARKFAMSGEPGPVRKAVALCMRYGVRL